MNNDKPFRIIFAGTPEFAAKHLEALLLNDYQICAVLTQPDRPAGRGRKITPSPVKQIALENGLRILQPETLHDEEVHTKLKELNVDLLIDVAYGLIIPKAMLSMPKIDCINVHASLLPRWRGAAPIQRAILAGDKETGVTIMRVEEKLDTGPLFLKATTPIYDTDTTGTLTTRLAELGSRTLIKFLQQLEEGEVKPEPQNDEESSYAKKIEKSEAKIDWSQSAIYIHRQIRALNPWPIAQAEMDHKTVKIWQATPIINYVNETPGTIIRVDKDGVDVATSDGTLRIQMMQFANGKPLSITDILNSKKEWLLNNKCFY